MTIPDYLVIGAITKDLINGGYTVGGTVTYAAVTARRLGKRAAVVTSAGPDLILPKALEGVQVARVPAEATTTFRNVYVNGRRKQYVSALASSIRPADIPVEWRRVSLVHLGPLVEKLLPHLTALILSDEDVAGDQTCIERFAGMTWTLVVTHGPGGATVYHKGQKRHFPTRPAREVDLTGAGDVFAAAFLIRLSETAQTPAGEDPWEAARFANVVGSFSVEGQGTTAIPSREQVEAYLKQTR
jgi:sugar/nucleoside kinase (ribokinase family)